MAQTKRKKRRRRRAKQRRHGHRLEEAAAHAEKRETPAARRPRRRRRPDGPPPAPWGSFPLVELIVLTAIVAVVIGLVFASGERQIALIGVGLALGSLAGLEIAVREHLAGYRSHTLLLAAVPAAVVLGLMFALASSLHPLVRAGIGAGVFALAAWGLTRMFRGRSGGYSFKISTRA